MFANCKRLAVVVVVICLLVSAAFGDSLQLKNGSMINGKYFGGSENEISFQVGSTVQRYAVADVASITFETSENPSERSEAPPLEPRPSQPRIEQVTPGAPLGKNVTVPSGNTLMIRTIDAIDSDRNQVGDKFQASLEQPIIVDDEIIVPKGADVYGRLTQATTAGKIQGRSQLKLELTGIVVNNQTIPLVTGDYSVSGSSRGASSAKRVGGAAAGGAVLGAIIGGGKGAAVGAGVGAGAGTAVQVATKGEQVHVPSETLLQFVLQQDVRIPVASENPER
jgi:hypothetical protein